MGIIRTYMWQAVVILSISFLLSTGCRGSNSSKRSDTTVSGVAGFACDQSLGVPIGQEADVFEALYANAGLVGHYMSEAGAVDLLMKDSIRLCFITRDFTPAEREYLSAKNPHTHPRSRRIATDGIAVITHPRNPIQRMSTTELAYIMMGWVTRWEEISGPEGLGSIAVVFDSPTSGAARFIKDSLCAGGRFSDRLRALDSNEHVIDYVASNPGALGIIGSGWIVNPHDPEQASSTQRIKVLAISRSHPATEDTSFLPNPANLHLRLYPLTRDVYYLLTDLKGTLPSGFANFISSDRGQKIILKSGLVPAQLPVRTIRTRDEI